MSHTVTAVTRPKMIFRRRDTGIALADTVLEQGVDERRGRRATDHDDDAQ
jgi:hypothetical protein